MSRPAAEALRDDFAAGRPEILFVGRMTDRGVGPHPIPQYEVHFLEGSLTGGRRGDRERQACARWFIR